MVAQLIRFVTVAVVALSLMTAGAQPAAAAPPPLTGEILAGTAATVGPLCPSNFAGNASYTFTASGAALGPYPGTFTETGSFTVNLDNEDTITFSSTFAINSSSGTVQGQKSGVINSHDGSCFGTSEVDVDGNSHVFSEDFTSNGTANCTPPSGSNRKQCQDAEKRRHHDAVKAEDALHHQNMRAATTPAQKMAEEQRHRATEQAEKDLHHSNQKQCKTLPK